MIHILNFSFQVSIHIGYIRNRLSSLVNDKTRTSSIRELIDTFVSNNLDELDMTVLDSDWGQVLVDEITEFIAVLIQVQDNKVLSRCLSYFTNVLVTWNFVDLSVFYSISMWLEFSHSTGIKLFSEVVLKVEIIFQLFKPLLILTVQNVL